MAQASICHVSLLPCHDFVLSQDWFVTHTVAAEVWLLCVSFSMKLEILMNREAEDNEL